MTSYSAKTTKTKLKPFIVDLCHRRVQIEASTAEGQAKEQAFGEEHLRREWAGRMKAAEWALKAHRDKQVTG